MTCCLSWLPLPAARTHLDTAVRVKTIDLKGLTSSADQF